MNNLSKNALIQEMSVQDMTEVNGGFIPLVVLGMAVSGKTIAIATASGIFLAGAYVGFNQKK